MIIIKHNCSKCQNELSFNAGDIIRKYEHLTVKSGQSPAGNEIVEYELSGHKFIICPCCEELNILGECSETTAMNPFDITRQAEWRNRYGVIAMQRSEYPNEWNLFSKYDKDVPEVGIGVIHL